VLIAAARRLPTGRAVGVDLWTRDQGGNSPEVTLANAAAAGVADRVEVHTADMIALPFPIGSFNVVTSAMAIHNIPSPERRYRARWTKPCWCCARQAAAHRRSLAHGQEVCQAHRPGQRPLGPATGMAARWLSITLLHTVKER
jgi:hypothetical protein